MRSGNCARIQVGEWESRGAPFAVGLCLYSMLRASTSTKRRKNRGWRRARRTEVSAQRYGVLNGDDG